MSGIRLIPHAKSIKAAIDPCERGDRSLWAAQGNVSFTGEEIEALNEEILMGGYEILHFDYTCQPKFYDNDPSNDSCDRLCVANMGDSANYRIAGRLEDECVEVLGKIANPASEDDRGKKCDLIIDKFKKSSADPSFVGKAIRSVRMGVITMFGPLFPFGLFPTLYRALKKRSLCAALVAGESSLPPLIRRIVGGGAVAAAATTAAGKAFAKPDEDTEGDLETQLGNLLFKFASKPMPPTGPEIPDRTGVPCDITRSEVYVVPDGAAFSDDDIGRLRRGFFGSEEAKIDLRKSDAEGWMCWTGRSPEMNRMLENEILLRCESEVLSGIEGAQEKCRAFEETVAAYGEETGWGTTADFIGGGIGTGIAFFPGLEGYHFLERKLGELICRAPRSKPQNGPRGTGKGERELEPRPVRVPQIEERVPMPEPFSASNARNVTLTGILILFGAAAINAIEKVFGFATGTLIIISNDIVNEGRMQKSSGSI